MTSLKTRDYIFLGLVFLIFIGCYIRLFFGVDITDESYYISLPYRFILGDRPFINEYSLSQLPALITLPFYKLFYLITHSTTGIVLFARHLFYLLYLMLGFITFRCFKRDLGLAISAFIASVCLLYIPFNIHALSYNTLAIFFFSVGLLLSFNNENDEYRTSQLILIGLCFPLAACSYPPFIIPILVSLAILFARQGIKSALPRILCGALPAVLFVCILLIKYWQYLPNLINYMQQAKVGQHQDFITHLTNAWLTSILNKTLLLSLFAVTIAFTLSIKYEKELIDSALELLPSKALRTILFYVGLVAAILLPILLIFLYLEKYFVYDNPLILYYLIINFSLLAPVYSMLAFEDLFVKRVLIYLWIPSFIAGVVTSWSSSNGFIGAMIGLFPALLATLAVFYRSFNIFLKRENFKPFEKVTSHIPYVMMAIPISMFLVYKFNYIYRDANIFQLDSKVDSGPFKGIYTTYTKSIMLTDLSEDLRYIEQSLHAKNIAVYPSASAFYLFSGLKPQVNSLWLLPQITNKLTIDYFNREGMPQVSIIFTPLVMNANDEVLKLMTSPQYILYKSRDSYMIYLSRKLME